MMSDLLPGPVPLPALLAGGATVVVGTAAALTGRAAARPDLPASRWHRRLPPVLTAVADHRATRVVLPVVGLAVTVAAVVALVRAGGPVDGTPVVPVLVAATLLGGPLVRLADPVRLLDGLISGPRSGGPPVPAAPAVVRCAALAAIALASDDGRVLAAALVIHLLSRTVVALRRGPGAHRRHGVVEAVVGVVGPLASVGRDPGGRLAWRNPLVAAAHTPQPSPALWLTAVLAGMALHLGTVGDGLQPVLTGAAAALAAHAVLRVAIIRDWFSGVLAPLAAAHGLLAAGGWLAPLDLVAFVGLHAVAVAVLHREAIARHDLRTARAVQLPPRLAVLVSVLAGLAAAGPATSG